MKPVYIPVREYAARYGVSVQNIYQQIRRGTLKSKQGDRKILVRDDLLATPDSDKYLKVNDYAKKYGVSVSTIRDRIKKNLIPWMFAASYYWVFDAPITLKKGAKNEKKSV